MDYNRQNKGFVCFMYGFGRSRAVYAVLMILMALLVGFLTLTSNAQADISNLQIALGIILCGLLLILVNPKIFIIKLIGYLIALAGVMIALHNANLLGADFGYCLDCCEIGELIYENWNAADCTMVFKGVSAHPMNAKGKLVNSLLLAHKFISLLPGGEVPECTEGKEGYFWVKELSGNSAKTTLKIDIREFDEVKFQKRLEFLSDMANSFNKIYGERCEITLKTRYENVFKFLKDENSLPIKLVKDAFSELNITPNIKPMRGGYDGAAISAKGVPTLNLFTGANNFHSIFEYLPVSSLKAASEVIKKIVINAAK